LDVFRWFAERFDIRSIDRKCNKHGCSKNPMKRIDINDNGFVASLFFCNEHYRGFLTDEICEARKELGKNFRTKVFEIGYVTF